jgi:hypothetical protein
MKRLWKSIALFTIANMLALTAPANAQAEPQYVKFRSQIVGCYEDLYYALNESTAEYLARVAEIYLDQVARGRPIIGGEVDLKTKCQFYKPSKYGMPLEKTSSDGVPAGKIAVCFQPGTFATGQVKPRPCAWAVVRPEDVIIANDWR